MLTVGVGIKSSTDEKNRNKQRSFYSCITSIFSALRVISHTIQLHETYKTLHILRDEPRQNAPLFLKVRSMLRFSLPHFLQRNSKLINIKSRGLNRNLSLKEFLFSDVAFKIEKKEKILVKTPNHSHLRNYIIIICSHSNDFPGNREKEES